MKLFTALGFFSILLLSGCGSFQAKRVDAQESDEQGLKITDNWVAKDTELVVDDLVKQLEGHVGFSRYKSTNGIARPKIFVAEIKNLTSEAYFPINDINDEFLHRLSQSDQYVLVDATNRERILSELTYQHDGMVAPEDIKKIGAQAGADLLVFGNVYMKPESRDGKTIKEYVVNLHLSDLEKGVEVARARKKLYKYSNKRSWGF